MIKQLEQLLQEHETDNSLNSFNKTYMSESLQKPPFYSEDESTTINEYINVLKTKLFLTPMEVCEVVQNFTYVSKYNLKRNLMKKKDDVTFVCSCISKKPFKKSLMPMDGGTITVQSLIRPNDSNSIEEKEQLKHTFGYNRPKRLNEEACRFRLRFKYDIAQQGYLYFDQSYLVHNHNPENPKSNQAFRCILRNIKFPLDLVLYVFKTMINTLINECTLSNNKIVALRNKCYLKYDVFSVSKKKKDKSVIGKKLTYFLNQTRSKLERLSKDNALLLEKDKMLDAMLGLFLKKSSGSYLEFQDAQALKEMFDSQ